MRRIYIAGPMANRPRYNFGAFTTAESEWNGRGWQAVTPMICSHMVWLKHFGRPFNPDTDKCDYGDPILKEMYAEDIKLLMSCDDIALLPDWNVSRGALGELYVSSIFKMPVYDAITFEGLELNPVVHIPDYVTF